MKLPKSAKAIPQNIQTLLLMEIFTAYQEVNELKKKSPPPEIVQTLMDIRRGLNLILTHLSPLAEQSNHRWIQLRAE